MSVKEQSERPVCLVTGGSSGIGLAAARTFAADGFRVAIVARDRNRLANAAEAVSACAGDTCVWLQVDLSDYGAPLRLIAAVEDRLGRLDVLVNAAGVAILTAAGAHDPQAFEEMWRVNGRALAGLSRSAWPIFQRQEGGVIVHVSSMSAFDPYPGLGVYGATKAWANHFIRTLADEGRPFNVRAYSVCPGAVETPMLRRLYPDFPAERALAPDAVAGVIRLLCEPAMSPASGNAITMRL